MEDEELTLQTEDAEGEGDTELDEEQEPETEDAEDTADESGNEEGERAEEPAAPTDPSTDAEEPAPAEVRIPVEFSDGTRDLSMQEVGEYARKGAKYAEIEPMWEEICRMAEERQETPERLIQALAAAEDKILYDRMLREAGGNKSVADRLVELEKSKRKSARETVRQQRETVAQTERQALTDRLASEFIEVKAEFPEYAEFSELPKSVVEIAAKQKLHLMDALLRHQRAETKKINQNSKAKEAAAATSVGSLAATVPESSSVDPYIQAMREGFASVW